MRATIIGLLLLSSLTLGAQEGQAFFSAGWWNVENLFDTRNDSLTLDDDFTPEGSYHWTRNKFETKRNGIYKTLLLMDLPDVVGLAEVENSYVLRELCQATPLRQAHYTYVHYDSPDRRGIDVALLYRTDRFTVATSRPICVSDSTVGFFTRDILLVEGNTLAGDTLALLLNHWPSKRGGATAELHRKRIALTLRHLMDSLHTAHPAAIVLAMGDFNATTDEEVLSTHFGLGDSCRNAEGVVDLVCQLPKNWGSYKYQGQWDYIDHLLLRLPDGSSIRADADLIRLDHLLSDELHRPGQRPHRTYQGPKYLGGLSDHLPLLLQLQHP